MPVIDVLQLQFGPAIIIGFGLLKFTLRLEMDCHYSFSKISDQLRINSDQFQSEERRIKHSSNEYPVSAKALGDYLTKGKNPLTIIKRRRK